MTTPRPLPDTSDPLARPYWAAMRQGRLEMQKCAACGYVRWPAARACPECLTVGGDWTALSGEGEIWSYATYEQPMHPAFADDCPYAVGLVRLAEGPMLYGRLLDPPDKLSCGRPVRAEFVALSDEITVVQFRLR